MILIGIDIKPRQCGLFWLRSEAMLFTILHFTKRRDVNPIKNFVLQSEAKQWIHHIIRCIHRSLRCIHCQYESMINTLSVWVYDEYIVVYDVSIVVYHRLTSCIILRSSQSYKKICTMKRSAVFVKNTMDLTHTMEKIHRLGLL